MNTNKTFARLFKKYRLRSEFETLKELADALAENGFIYEESIFSHWQKGTKTPKNRSLLLTLIKIFTARGGIVTLEQANQLLESVGQGYLTNTEIYSLPVAFKTLAPFQAPKEPIVFTGRDEQIKLLRQHLLENKVVLLHGPAGRGKTSLAIKLVHELKDSFPDGVLWYRLGVASTANILTSIAYTYGEDISRVKDDSVKSSIVRSLLNNKKFLLVFDNFSSLYDLDLLIPNSTTCAVLITSTHTLENATLQESVYLPVFSELECFSLYKTVLGSKYVESKSEKLKILFTLVGQSPLSVTITAKLLKQQVVSIDELIEEIQKESLELSHFSYENKTLSTVLNINYDSLSVQEKKILESLAVFISGNFSTNAVAYINKISKTKTKLILHKLVNLSFIDALQSDRWQIHPLLRIFLKDKFSDLKLYKYTANYYVDFLKMTFEQNGGYQILATTAADNIIHIFEKCLDLELYENALQLWKYLSSYLWDSGSWSSLMKFTIRVNAAAEKIEDYHTKVLCYIKEFSMLYYWKGDINKAEEVTKEGMRLAMQMNDPYLVAFAKERLAKIYLNNNKVKESEMLLNESLQFFLKTNNSEQVANSLRILGECKIVLKENDEAEKYMISSIKYYKQVSFPSLQYIYLGIIYYYLGGICLQRNNLTEARDYFKKCLDYFLEGGNKSVETAWGHIALGLYYEQNDNNKLAQENYIQAKKELLSLGGNKILKSKAILYFLLRDKLVKSALFKTLIETEK